MIPWLSRGDPFPPVDQALPEPNGLLAASQTLSASDVLAAYPHGIFPWCSEGQPILWWSPDPRMVLLPGHLKISRSLRKNILRADYQIKIDTSFEVVMRCCAAPRKKEEGTWIREDFIQAYTGLHRQGIAHSVEVWNQDDLIGGLYGISLGSLFFGESMFAKKADCSKIALAFLCFLLEKLTNSLIDCQVANPHLASLGAVEIDRADFCLRLKDESQDCLDWSEVAANIAVWQHDFLSHHRNKRV